MARTGMRACRTEVASAQRANARAPAVCVFARALLTHAHTQGNCGTYKNLIQSMGMSECAEGIEHNRTAAQRQGKECSIELERERYTGDHSKASLALVAAARDIAAQQHHQQQQQGQGQG